MQIIINSFLSQIVKIIISTLILSIISVSLFYYYKNDRDSTISQMDNKKIVKVHIRPLKDKYPIIFNEALDVIFFKSVLTDNSSHKNFEEYKFDRNLVLNFDLDQYKTNFNSALSENVLDITIENRLNELDTFYIIHTVKNYSENLNLEIYNSIKNYIEPKYKKSILKTLESLIQFKINFSDPINKKRNEEIINKNKNLFDDLKKYESFTETLSLLLIEETDENVLFVYDELKKFIENYIDFGFEYKVTVENFDKGRKAFVTNISSILVIILSLFISFVISFIFFVFRKITFD